MRSILRRISTRGIQEFMRRTLRSGDQEGYQEPEKKNSLRKTSRRGDRKGENKKNIEDTKKKGIENSSRRTS